MKLVKNLKERIDVRVSFNHLQRTDPAFHMHYATLKVEAHSANEAAHPFSWLQEVKPSENGKWQAR